MTKKQTQLRDISREELASIGYYLVPSHIPAAKSSSILHLGADNEPGGP
jgi:hypothetical protein